MTGEELMAILRAHFSPDAPVPPRGGPRPVLPPELADETVLFVFDRDITRTSDRQVVDEGNVFRLGDPRLEEQALSPTVSWANFVFMRTDEPGGVIFAIELPRDRGQPHPKKPSIMPTYYSPIWWVHVVKEQ